MGFVPVYLGEADVAVVQLYAGGALSLAPVAGTVDPPQSRKLADASALRDGLSMRNPPEDAKVQLRAARGPDREVSVAEGAKGVKKTCWTALAARVLAWADQMGGGMTSVHIGVPGCRAFAHGLGCKGHPGVEVEPEPGIEFGTQSFGVVQGQCDQSRGYVTRLVLEHEADLLGAIERTVFGAEREQGQATHPGSAAAPGLRLHPLKGDRAGQWSVRVSGNWRVVFRFEDGEAVDVDLLDYH